MACAKMEDLDLLSLESLQLSSAQVLLTYYIICQFPCVSAGAPILFQGSILCSFFLEFGSPRNPRLRFALLILRDEPFDDPGLLHFDLVDDVFVHGVRQLSEDLWFREPAPSV